jgi:hypothetical protein
MDLFDRFAGNDSWDTRRLLEYAGTLTEEQLDRPLLTVVELLPWRESNKTLRHDQRPSAQEPARRCDRTSRIGG